jgi:polygalacturonase
MARGTRCHARHTGASLMSPSRREFLRRVALGTLGVASSSAVLAACARASGATAIGGIGKATRDAATASGAAGWSEVPAILARIKAPVFASRVFDITAFGAIADGTFDSSNAITKAIAACRAAGGGRVLVPAGKFITGPIHLASKVELHVAKGATLAFVTDPARYLPAVLTRFEGVELYGYSPLIYAIDAVDVGVTGEGTLDGQADATHWWSWKGGKDAANDGRNQLAARERLFGMAERGVPVAERRFGEGDYLRSSFVQTYRCRNVIIADVTIVRSPMWEVHPVLSQNVTVRNVSISTHGPNNDGCDPESCRDVLIEGCTFDTGDDCIAIKSGRNADGRRVGVPTENVIIRQCRMKDGHGGVTIGSEISGSVRHVYVENCQMDSPSLDRALRLKTNAMRGGTLEHIYMRNVTVGQVADSMLSIDFTYEEGDQGSFMPVVRDIEMRNVTSTKSKYGLYLRGFEKAPIADVRIVDCKWDGVAKADVLEHVTGLTRTNVTVNGKVVGA